MPAVLLRPLLLLFLGMLTGAFFPRVYCGWSASAWLRGDADTEARLAEELVAFEAEDDATRASSRPATDRFTGEWALVTHQMTALGLAQICLAHPELKARFVPTLTKAAIKSWLPEMRDFGTHAWGEDAMASLWSPHGHAYLAYAALAVGMARVLDPAFPRDIASQHDLMIGAYIRRLSASQTGLIETYPGEAYPTDVAAVAAAIAVHARATGGDHQRVINAWAEKVLTVQIDKASGLVIQRMSATDGKPHDAPRGSGTALGAYFAGFADRKVAALLTQGVLRQEASFLGFGAIREYAPGHSGKGDVDSGPVLLGVSVSATGFALAPLRAHGHEDAFTRIYRTVDLFGVPFDGGSSRRFLTGGAIGNALMLALLTSGPELAP
ncbi:MAG: hypothetical protein U0359_01065 [Byssovorax sp.]